ncbi:MAG: hypothetical protein B6I32_05815 [Desulfobacterium sp. 4572_20]|nr:MAG: hypothetical protein B6I32_05815 [Desulfobacterium sp. 4572_20]
MLNRDCKRENRSRIQREADSRIDFDCHAPLLTPQEAEYEASRCLGTISCEACDICRLLCPDMAITVRHLCICVSKGGNYNGFGREFMMSFRGSSTFGNEKNNHGRYFLWMSIYLN